MSSFDVQIEIAAENVLGLLMEDKVKDAISISDQYLDKDIHHPYFHFCKAITYLGENNIDKFYDLFDHIRSLPTVNYLDFYNFGLFFQRNQAYQLAIECFGESAGRQPDFVECYVQLGDAFLALGEYAGAQQSYLTVLDLSPNDTDCLYKLGLCLEKQHFYEEARSAYEKGYKLLPNSKVLRCAIARCHLAAGEVKKSYRLFIKDLDPLNTSREEQVFLLQLFSDADQLSWYQRLNLERCMGFNSQQILNQLIAKFGIIFATLPQKFISLFRYKNKLLLPKVIVKTILAPFIMAEILSQYILGPLKLLPPSEDHIKGPHPLFSGRLSALLLRPFLGAEEATTHLDSAAQTFYRLGWTERAEALARENLKKLPTQDRADTLTRILLTSKACSAEEFYHQSIENAEKLALPAMLPSLDPDLSPERVLNVGLMSDFFHGQIAFTTLIHQLQIHDREKIRIFLYDSGEHTVAHMYPNLVYHHIPQLEDDFLNRLIRKEGIDILIEMNGPLRPNNRLGVIRRRAAPIQVSWYNLCATTGIKEVDRVVTDEVSVPPDQQKYFTEKLLLLEGKAVGGWKLDEDPPLSAPPFQKNGFFTFGCFGDSFKINADVISTWSKVLHRVPNSKFFIKNEFVGKALTRLFYVRAFALEGIPPNRLIFESFTPYKHMCKRYQDVDLVLDTFPYTNGSTTMNALWQGVPTLTIAGPDWRSRMSLSIMASAQLDHFICTDKEAFIERAVEIARSPEQLIELRLNMRSHLLAHSRYFQIEEYTRDFEKGMRSMWHDYISEQKTPVHKSKIEANG